MIAHGAYCDFHTSQGAAGGAKLDSFGAEGTNTWDFACLFPLLQSAHNALVHVCRRDETQTY